MEQIEALKDQIRKALMFKLEHEKIFFYAESIKQPWGKIYTGSEANPTIDDIRGSPGEWVKTPFHGVLKPFAHLYQRQITYPFGDDGLLERWKKAIFFIWFAGNRGGKSVAGTNFVSMLCLGIHPLQDLGIKRKPPLHGWVVSPNLPSESDVPRGEDAPILKKFYEWIPDMEVGFPYGIRRFYRKDKLMAIVDKAGNESVVNFKSLDQDINKFKSEDVDFILWDEDPKNPTVWEEGKMRLIDRNGSAFLAMTPDYDSVFTYQMRQKEADNPKYFFVGGSGAEENPFLSRDAVRAIIGDLSSDSQLLRGKGKHIQFKGKVFPFERSVHVSKPFVVSNDCANFVITDWHPVKPVVTSFLSINSQNIWYVWGEYIEQEHIVDHVAQGIWSKLSLKSNNLKIRKWLIDKIARVQQIQSRPGAKPKDIITMFREVGIRYIAGDETFEAAHTFLCQKMNLREFYIDPSCEYHIEQFDTWGAKRYQKGFLEGTLRDQLEGEGNDSCINMVYAFNAKARYDILFEDGLPPDELPRRPHTERLYGSARL